MLLAVCSLRFHRHLRASYEERSKEEGASRTLSYSANDKLELAIIWSIIGLMYPSSSKNSFCLSSKLVFRVTKGRVGPLAPRPLE